MNLSERLERARIERGIAEGTVHSEQALRPIAPEREAEPEPVRADPISIELPPTGLAAVASEPTHRPSIFSGPDGSNASSCPTCKRPGHLDMVDLVGHRTHYSCASCGSMWNVLDEQAAAASRNR